MDIGGGAINLFGFGADERVRVGVEDRGEGVEDEASVVGGDLEGL